MGVVFSGMFGLGIVLYVSIETNAHLDHILFGNMLGVDRAELWTSGLISLVVAGLIILKWKDLLLYSFDPAQAQTSGLSVNWLHYGLLAGISLAVVATLSATGLILAIGLLIAPGCQPCLRPIDAGRHLCQLLPRQCAGPHDHPDSDDPVHPRICATAGSDPTQVTPTGGGGQPACRVAR